MTDLRAAAQQALEALERDELDMVQDSEGHMVFRKEQSITALRAALEQPEQATVKGSLQVGLEEPEGGWQSAPSPQVTQRIADMPVSEYRRGVNDGFKLGLREGRIKAEDEMREQPEQEPVAWPEGYEPHELPADYTGKLWLEGQVRRLYETHSPRREWQGLDAEEIWGMTCECGIDYECAINFGKDIEAALKEKNA